MKKGRNVGELMAELERQLKTKRDYKAPAGRLYAKALPDGFTLEMKGVGQFGVKDTAHEQFGQYLDIPKKYYDRMRADSPALLAINMNEWLNRKGGEARLVRTLDGDVRALLSDRYRDLDNFDLMNAILPIIKDDADFDIHSCEVTERRLYLQVVHKKLKAQLTGVGHNTVKVEDELQAGLVISNSEIGEGSLKVEPAIYTAACTNMMISTVSLRRYHVGRVQAGDGDNATEFFRDETRKADDKAFWMKVQDTVRGAFDEAKFKALVRKLEGATEPFQTTLELPAIVEVVATRYGFTEGEKKAVENHFLREGDFSQYGILNAVTRAAQDADSYDRAIELERFGGDILNLNEAELVPVKR